MVKTKLRTQIKKITSQNNKTMVMILKAKRLENKLKNWNK